LQYSLLQLITALATPTAEPISMLLLMIPLIILYFMAAGIAYLNDRRKQKKADKLSEGLDS